MVAEYLRSPNTGGKFFKLAAVAVVLATLVVGGAGGGWSAAANAGETAKPRPTTVTLRPALAGAFRGLKLPEPAVRPFTGKPPVTIEGRQPRCKFTKDRLYVFMGAVGRADYRDGSLWRMRVLYPGKVRGTYSWKVVKTKNGWGLRSAELREGRFAGHRFALLDLNSDGRFDGVGTDTAVFDGGVQAKVGVPFKLDGKYWRLKVTPSGMRATVAPSSAAAPVEMLAPTAVAGSTRNGNAAPLDFSGQAFGTDVKGALGAWNAVRAGLGLLPVTCDKELEKAGYKHIEYMRRNGMTHYESKGKDGYSPEGAKAGKGSDLSKGQPNAKLMVMGLLDTFYHRVAMIKPELAVSGISYDAASRYGVVNVHNGKKRRVKWTEPLLYPPPGATGVRPGWSGREGPSPIPGKPPKGGVGQTVTVTFPRRTKVVEAKIALKEGEKAVEAWVTSPEKPAPAGKSMFRTNMDTICLIPKHPLKPRTVYTVEVSAKVNGKPFARRWRFTTGEAPVYPWRHRRRRRR